MGTLNKKSAFLTISPFALALALASLGAGCLGPSPEQQLAAMYGDGDDDGDPEHNPGEPCLVCHGENYSPGEAVFAVAGTIYLRASDRRGLGGAEVLMNDAQGRSFSAITNEAGNFMVSVRGQGEDDDEGGGPDWPVLSYVPDFPLSVTVREGGLEQEMETLIRREGSCSMCHYQEPGPDSAGRIFLVEGP